jgi:hypothetical protein
MMRPNDRRRFFSKNLPGQALSCPLFFLAEKLVQSAPLNAFLGPVPYVSTGRSASGSMNTLVIAT